MTPAELMTGLGLSNAEFDKRMQSALAKLAFVEHE
jgi:hypothetical protein